eukprot:1577250-Rhodomonas_salina.5
MQLAQPKKVSGSPRGFDGDLSESLEQHTTSVLDTAQAEAVCTMRACDLVCSMASMSEITPASPSSLPLRNNTWDRRNTFQNWTSHSGGRARERRSYLRGSQTCETR